MNDTFIDIYNDKYRNLSIMTFHDKLIQYNNKIVEGGHSTEILKLMVEIINKYFKLNENCPFITNSILHDIREYRSDHMIPNYIIIETFTTIKDNTKIIVNLDEIAQQSDEIIIPIDDDYYILLQDIIDIGEKNIKILELLSNTFNLDLKNRQVKEYIPAIYFNNKNEKEEEKETILKYNIIKRTITFIISSIKNNKSKCILTNEPYRHLNEIQQHLLNLNIEQLQLLIYTFRFFKDNITDLINLYDLFNNNNNILLNYCYKHAYCLYIHKVKDNYYNLYRINTNQQNVILNSNLHTKEELFPLLIKDIVYKNKNKNKNKILEYEDEDIVLTTLYTDIVKNYPCQQLTQMGGTCYFASILVSTILFFYLNIDYNNKYYQDDNKNKSIPIIDTFFSTLITSEHTIENSEKTKIFRQVPLMYNVLLYSAYRLFLIKYTKNNVIHINNSNYTSYYNYIYSYLNELYHSYKLFYSKNYEPFINNGIILMPLQLYLYEIQKMYKFIITNISSINKIKPDEYLHSNTN